MCPGGRRQRGGDGVEACCYLGRDETGKSKRVEQSTVDSAIEETATGGCFLYWGPEGSLEGIVKSIAAVLMRRTEARRAAS